MGRPEIEDDFDVREAILILWLHVILVGPSLHKKSMHKIEHHQQAHTTSGCNISGQLFPQLAVSLIFGGESIRPINIGRNRVQDTLLTITSNIQMRTTSRSTHSCTIGGLDMLLTYGHSYGWAFICSPWYAFAPGPLQTISLGPSYHRHSCPIATS